MQREQDRKAQFQKVIFRKAETILSEHRLECLVSSTQRRTHDDQLLYESLKLEMRREFIHALFFLGMPISRSQNASTSSNFEKEGYSRRGTKKLFKTQSSFFFNFRNLRQAQLSLKLLKFLSLDDMLLWRNHRARDWRRHSDFLSCHRISFRKLRQYLSELEEVWAEEEYRDKGKKGKKAEPRERPIFDEIAEFHTQFDLLVEEFRYTSKVNVVDSALLSPEHDFDLAGKPAPPKNKKNVKKEEEEAPAPRVSPAHNISWNYLRKTPREEIRASTGTIQGPDLFSTKSPAPTFSAFVKSDFWTRLHCFYDFDPIMRSLKEMEINSQNVMSFNQSSQFKMSGNNGFSIEENVVNKKDIRALNPWGATFSGVSDFYHPPNEFIFWLSSCLQGLLDNQMESLDSDGPSFLQNIYPQRNGVPVLSETGEYWVRLNYMGKSVRVRVDDRLPVDCLTGELMVPLTETGEIWPALFAKAICKLFGIGDFYKTEEDWLQDTNIQPISADSSGERESKKVVESNEQSQITNNFSINSSIFQNRDLMQSAMMRKTLIQDKENMPRLDEKNLKKIQRVFQNRFKRTTDFYFEDLISNIDVVYTVTGFVPLVLQTKNWDNVFFSKFCEAISEDNLYKNQVKVFGLKQVKVSLTRPSDAANAPFPSL